MSEGEAGASPGALVIGAAGQDGHYLCASLERDGYAVTRVTRHGASGAGGTIPGDMVADPHFLKRLVAEGGFREAYYLAAHHHSAETLGVQDGALLQRSIGVHAVGFGHVLEAVRVASPTTRVFYAASSHLFGEPVESPQSEDTPFSPVCIYGMTKLLAVHAARFYRRSHGVHVGVGILYNHESPRRSPRFLSRKVTQAAFAIAQGRAEPLVLGNLDAVVDWGYAGDYVEAMRAMVGLPEPADFVIASGRAHRVRDFVAEAFSAVGLDWQQHVRVDPTILGKSQVSVPRVGDPSRLRAATGWSARTSLPELVRIMLAAEARPGDSP